MDYELTLHAKKRMKERNITDKIIKDGLKFPTKITYDHKGALLIKKLYHRKGKQRLLLIAGQMLKDKLTIFTIIDTTKISKYL